MTKTLLYISFFFSSFSVVGQIHPIVKTIFYDLPLEKSRKDLREAIVNDQRFTSKDTISNIFKNSMPYFSGTTSHLGLLKSKPDSVEILLVVGNTPLVTEKGGQTEFTDVLILNCKYFYSNKDNVEIEYQRLLTRLHSILPNERETKMETLFSKDATQGQLKTRGMIFESFAPYYSVEIISASTTNFIYSKNKFGLYIEFRRIDN